MTARNVGKEEHWRGVAKQWKASEMTAAEFCRQNEINKTMFYSWLKVIAKRDRQVKAQAPSEATFVPIVVKPAIENSKPKQEAILERVEIWLNSGNVIRAGTITPKALGELLKELGNEAC